MSVTCGRASGGWPEKKNHYLFLKLKKKINKPTVIYLDDNKIRLLW